MQEVCSAASIVGRIQNVSSRDLLTFISELRRVLADRPAEAQAIARVEPLLKWLVRDPNPKWLKAEHLFIDENQGFGVRLLHEADDHTLAVMSTVWLPGRSTQPHNHGTWGLVGGLSGFERNTSWRRLDDGSRPGHAEIQRVDDFVIGPGDVAAFLPDAIHSVVNEGKDRSVSIHVYGRHVNHTERYAFDPVHKRATPLTIQIKS